MQPKMQSKMKILILSLVVILMLFSNLVQADGKATWYRKCSGCHGMNAEGTSLLMNTNLAARGVPGNAIEIVTQGKPGTAMPPWKGKLTDLEIKEVVDYAKTLTKAQK